MSAQPAPALPEKQKKKNKKEKPKKTLKEEIMSWALTLIFALAILIALQAWVGQPIRVDGASMENTLHNGEYVWVSHRDRDYDRGDIVICHYPNRTEGVYRLGSALTLTHHTIFVKRLVALPGDTVEIRSERLYVNGVRVADPENMATAPRDFPLYRLGEDEYFVIGDNRFTSHDSRSSDVGPISGDMLRGKVKCVIWPLNQIRTVE